MSDRLRGYLTLKRPVPTAVIAAFGAFLTIVVLLTNNAGWAIVVATLILPAVAIVELSRRDVFEEEPKWGAFAALGWGVLVGLVAGILAASISGAWWISGATLHVGAGGFAGEAAKQAGTPGFGVLLLNGIVVPAIAIAASVLGPFALRRFDVFRNEVMDGVTLGFASGCGVATGMTLVFVWPLGNSGASAGGTVADWTALLTGMLVTRPVIFGLASGFVCAGIWHSSISKRSVDLMLPAGIGVGAAIAFSFVDLLIQPKGTRIELLWHGVIALALVAASKIVLARVVTQDRVTQTILSNRVICPNCGASTPSGLYCAICGSTLTSQADSNPIASIENASQADLDSTVASTEASSAVRSFE